MQRSLSGRGAGLCVRVKTRMGGSINLEAEPMTRGRLVKSVAAESCRPCLKGCVLCPEGNGNMAELLSL